MEQSYWGSWYAGWGWFLWIGIWFLMISSFGNWGYTYRVHRRYSEYPGKSALDILNERYVKGEVSREEFHKMKGEIGGGATVPAGQSRPSHVMPSPSPA